MLISRGLTNWGFHSCGTEVPSYFSLDERRLSSFSCNQFRNSFSVLTISEYTGVDFIYLFSVDGTSFLPFGNSLCTQKIFAALPENNHMQNSNLPNYYPDFGIIKCWCCCFYRAEFILSPVLNREF